MRFLCLMAVMLATGFFQSPVHAESPQEERIRSLENHLSDFEGALRTIVGRVERLEHNITQKPASLPVVETLPERAQKPAVTPSEPLSVSSEKEPSQTIAHYNQALELLKAKKFDEAKTSFQQFIQTYPESSFKVLAHYWIGVIHFIQKKYDAALALFHDLKKSFPQSPKKYDVLLKIASCYQAQGDKNRACQTLETCFKALDKDPQRGTLQAIQKRAKFLANQLQCTPRGEATP